MHNGTVGLDRSLNNLIVILEVDYDDLRLVTVGEGLSDTNVMIGFQSLAYGQSTQELKPIDFCCCNVSIEARANFRELGTWGQTYINLCRRQLYHTLVS